jgi:flagellar basal-body rod modification protein FlgD
MSISVPPVSTGKDGNPITGTSGRTLSGGTNSTMGTNGFLQLMMVQLTHQDPSNPTDPTQYLSELAQFTQVEQATNTAQSTAQTASAEAVSAAVGLIGHNVTYVDQNSGQKVNGAVQSVQIGTAGPTLTINGVAGIAPSTVTSVS